MLKQECFEYYQVKERDVLASIKSYLKYGGWYTIRVHQGLGSHRGVSDLVAVKDGITVWIECKSPRGTLSKDQQTFREAIEAHGGIYLLVRSIDDLVQQLEARGIRP